LANANLGSDPAVRREIWVSGIDPNGAMNFQKALEWVAALNAYNHGAGYLGHNNWQLPIAPLRDATCADTGSGGGSFGPLCAGSALGNLFYVGLRATYPDGVALTVSVAVPPFSNLPLSYFWASQNNGGTGGGAGACLIESAAPNEWRDMAFGYRVVSDNRDAIAQCEKEAAKAAPSVRCPIKIDHATTR
jgi:hypothetical protein